MPQNASLFSIHSPANPAKPLCRIEPELCIYPTPLAALTAANNPRTKIQDPNKFQKPKNSMTKTVLRPARFGHYNLVLEFCLPVVSAVEPVLGSWILAIPSGS